MMNNYDIVFVVMSTRRRFLPMYIIYLMCIYIASIYLNITHIVYYVLCRTKFRAAYNSSSSYGITIFNALR